MGLRTGGVALRGGDKAIGAGRRASLLLTSAATVGLFVGAAHAQQAAQAGETTDQEQQKAQQAPAGTTLLDKITVVSRTAKTAIDTMASVSHVDQEQLDRRMAASPADMLFGVPGVTMQSDGRRSASSVNIRGLQDFGRVAVIVDGARQNFQRSDHGAQSIFWLDPELVKSVDVIRGPVANTYGSGAIGGVVYFQTKDAADFLKPDETWAASTTGRFDSNGRGWTTSATGAWRIDDRADVLGNIVYRNYDDYKDGDGNTVEGTGFDVLSGMLKTTVRPTENSELKLGWVGANDHWSQVSGGTPVNDLDMRQNTFTGSYNLTDEEKSWLDLHINFSYSRTYLDQVSLVPQARRFDPITGMPVTVPAGAQTNFDLGTLGADVWNTSRFETGAVSHELTYGGDWVGDDIVNTGTAGGDSFYTPSGKRNVSGAYIQDKLTWDWLEVIGGLRYDSYSLKGTGTESSGDRLSPRITVGVSPFENMGLEGLQFYGTYAEGYRSPTVTETLISGLHPAGVAFPFLPNPNLKPETAKTWEAGINYKRDGVFAPDDALRLKAAYFNNDIDDYIGGTTMEASFTDPTNICFARFDLLAGGGYAPICYQYQNYANATIRGFELEGVYEAAWGFAGLSVSLINGHTVSYDGVREDLVTIPSSQVTGQLGLRFLEDKLTVGGEVQYNGKPKGNADAKDYTLVNLFADYKVNDNFKIDFRVDNLFDEKYVNPLNPASGLLVYEPGVTFKIGATARFGG